MAGSGSAFEIYFVGLVCFVSDRTNRYVEADLLYDHPDHLAAIYIAGKNKIIPLSPGDTADNTLIQFDLPEGGPLADMNPDSPLPHLQPLITPPNATLDPNRQLAATVRLPEGELNTALYLNVPGKFTPPTGNFFYRRVNQLTLLSSFATQTDVTLSVGLDKFIVPPSSFVVIGNMSPKHDCTNNQAMNHFARYYRLTTGTACATLCADDTGAANGAARGHNFANALRAIQKMPNGATEESLGQADCSSSQFP